MLVALLAPHSSWSVCLSGACNPVSVNPVSVAAAPAESCCCCSGAEADERDDSIPALHGDSCNGCCVDFALAIDDGPLPKPVTAPESCEQLVAVLPPTIRLEGSAHRARFDGFDTGPPRVDRTTALLSTTILRE